MTGSPSVETSTNICIGPNPSLDRTLVVAELDPGEVNRASQLLTQPGGKAANVAKVLMALGGTAILVGPIGGETGAEIRRLAEAAGLDCRWSESAVPTRMCTAIVGPVRGVETASAVTDVNESGLVDEEGWNSFLRLISEVTEIGPDQPACRVLLSGSIPSVGSQEPSVLLAEVTASIDPSARLWVDTSGHALRAVVEGKRAIDLLKINLAEALEYLGPDWLEAVSIDVTAAASDVLPEVSVVAIHAAAELAARIAGSVVVTLGSDGAVLCHGEQWWWGKVAVSEVVNPTGSGDSFFAGLAKEWENGPVEALRLALACGASNAAHLPAGVIDSASVLDLARRAVVVEGPRPE